MAAALWTDYAILWSLRTVPFCIAVKATLYRIFCSAILPASVIPLSGGWLGLQGSLPFTASLSCSPCDSLHTEKSQGCSFFQMFLLPFLLTPSLLQLPFQNCLNIPLLQLFSDTQEFCTEISIPLSPVDRYAPGLNPQGLFPAISCTTAQD